MEQDKSPVAVELRDFFYDGGQQDNPLLQFRFGKVQMIDQRVEPDEAY